MTEVSAMPAQTKPKMLLVDTDVHEFLQSVKELAPYLAREWQDLFTANPSALPKHIYASPVGGMRIDAKREDGTMGSAHLDQLGWQLLDAYGTDYAILTGGFGYQLSSMPQGEYASALASAYNDWVIENMLAKDARLRGSLCVAAQRPQLAAREIDRLGPHPSIVQIILSIASPSLPWGHEFFFPVWEACVRNNLRVAFHVLPPMGLLGVPNAAGWPGSYFELRAQYPTAYQAQLVSITAGGVLAKFPDLGVAMLEGGFGWLPSTMWRLDQTWRSLRSECPWLKKRPSEYIREQVRFSTQPLEEPDDPKHLGQVIDMLGSDRMLMFSSDYPHWDFDSPDRAVPKGLGDDLRRKIFGENALEFYGLPRPGGTDSDR